MLVEVIEKQALIDKIHDLHRPHGVSWKDQMAVLDQVEDTIREMKIYFVENTDCDDACDLEGVTENGKDGG